MDTAEKQYDRERHSAKRAAGRDVEISRPADLKRRRTCIDDPFEFMRSYFGWIFWQPFTGARQRMVDSIVHAARYSGDFAVADKRGGGKSGIALFTTFWLDLRCEVLLPLFIGKNQTGAQGDLSNLKQAIVESPSFADDFPEICRPIIALEDWASAARKQTVNGHRTKIGWEKDCLFLPTVPQDALPSNWPMSEKSVASGQGFAVVGIDGKIRGFKRRNVRPNFAVIDDIDDRESARSELQTADHRKAIDNDTIGLAGSGKRTSRVMLCTTLNDRCVAAIYTVLPGWRGQRFRAFSKMPERADLRDQYIEMRQTRVMDDPDARVAHAFYLENQTDIEAGGEVDNPYDFVDKPASDGKPLEVSAFQHYFNLIADTNWDSFLCEYQNDPPASEQITKTGLTRELIAKRLSGFNRCELPPNSKIVVGIDIGKLRCHWVATAFRKGGVGSIIHYGVIEVTGAEDADKQEVIEQAILRALIGWKEEIAANPFRDSDGNPVEISKTLIDSGYCPAAVYEMVRRYGDQFRATKGQSDSQFHPGRPSIDRQVGNFWFAKQESGRWLYHPNVDYWKRSVHERFLADPLDEDNRPRQGSLTLFVPAGKRDHTTFCQHIMSEEWVTEFIAGKGDKSHFVAHSNNNHFYDATALCLAGGEMIGSGMFACESVIQRPRVVSSGRQSQARW